MSTADSASAKIPPGRAAALRTALRRDGLDLARVMPMVSRGEPSTAARSAGVSAPPKKVRPMPTSSVGAQLEQHELALVGGLGQPDHEGDCPRRRERAVVTWVIFISLCLPVSLGRGALLPSPAVEPRLARPMCASDRPDVEVECAQALGLEFDAVAVLESG